MSVKIVNVHALGPSNFFPTFPVEKVLQIHPRVIPAIPPVRLENHKQLERALIGA